MYLKQLIEEYNISLDKTHQEFIWYKCKAQNKSTHLQFLSLRYHSQNLADENIKTFILSWETNCLLFIIV